ncbi:hypothetical protein JTB14_007727 [Gonioctena quinquepunctata]|nr:hypothetical protein JTB14_007727 [Gonioctena quinquepunctata]
MLRIAIVMHIANTVTESKKLDNNGHHLTDDVSMKYADSKNESTQKIDNERNKIDREYKCCEVIDLALSDHYGQFLEFELNQSKKENEFRMRRVFSEARLRYFSEELERKNWDEIMNCTEVLKSEDRKFKKRIKGTEDLTEEELKDRKILLAALKESRATNKAAYIKRKKLIGEGETYTAEDIGNANKSENDDNYF